MVSNGWRKVLNIKFLINCFVISFVIWVLAIMEEISVRSIIWESENFITQVIMNAIGSLLATGLMTSCLVIASLLVRSFREILIKIFGIEETEED